jgi:predicted MFS family arabinose efflux permease
MERNRWSVIVAFVLVSAGVQVVWLTYAPVTTAAAEHFGVSETAVGWLANMFPLFYVVLAIPAGVILDRWFRAGLAAGAILTVLGAALRLVDDTFGWALAGQTVAAIAQPLVLNAITSITRHYLRERSRPAGIALGTAANFAGMATAFVLGAVLPGSDRLGTLATIGTGFVAVAALAMVTTLVLVGEPRAKSPAGGWDALRAAAGDRQIRTLCAVVFGPFGTFIALTTFGQALLAPAGVSAETASVILLVTVLAAVLGCAIVPVVTSRRRAELPVLAIVALIGTAGCVGLAVTPGVAVGFTAMTAIGFFMLSAMPIVLEMVERRAGPAQGTATALIWIAGNLGGLVVATVVGALVHRPAVAFLICAVAALTAVPLLRGLRADVRLIVNVEVP